jgi:acetyl-CoA C-acetyltransferase
MAAQRIIAGEGDVFVAGGVETISCVQNEANRHMIHEAWLKEHKPELYWTMLQTAENVSKRYGIARDKQDEYGVQSQQRAAAAAASGRFADEIVPMTVTMGVADKASARLFTQEITISADEGIRRHDVRRRGRDRGAARGVIAAGNASHLRRRLGVRGDERQGRRQAGAKPLGNFAVSRSPAEPDDGHRPGVRGAQAPLRALAKVEDIGL